MIKIAILTVSDSCAQGQKEDISGQEIKTMLDKDKFEIFEKKLVADNREAIANELKYFSDKAGIDVVLTTGGTGLGPRDVTPEATASVCERIVPGLSEIIRIRGWKKTESAVLSRGIAGIRNKPQRCERIVGNNFGRLAARCSDDARRRTLKKRGIK